MKISDVIRTIMYEQDITLVKVAGRLGISQPTMSMRLKQKTIGADKAVEILKAMDYKLVAMPMNAKLPTGAYEVTAEDSAE